MYWTVFLALCIYSTIAVEFIEITPSPMGSIFAKNISKAKTFCRDRIIEYNIDIGDIERVKDDIKASVELLDKTCSATEFNTICRFLTDEIKILINEIDYKHKMIESANTESTHNYRKKRNIDEIPEILAKTITLSDFSYSDLKQSLDEVKTFFGFIEKSQNRQLSQIDQLNFNSLAQLIILKTKKYLNFYELIIDITLNPRKNKIAELISLETLKIEFGTIQTEAMKENCHIPIKMKIIEIAKYFKLSKIRAVIINKLLLVTINIPTYYQMEYELIKVISIPFTRNKSSYIITPSSPYYLNHIDEKANFTHSIPLSLEERLNCSSNSNHVLCSPKGFSRLMKYITIENTILITICNTEGLFTINIFKNQEKYTSGCDLNQIPHQNQLIHLHGNLYYLYIVKPASVKLICGESSINTHINKTVLIKKMKDCYIKFNDNWYSKLKEHKTKSIVQFSNNYASYSTFEQELIPKPSIVVTKLNPTRNLQSEYGKLQQQIRNHNSRPKVMTNILKSDELLLIILMIIILLIATWLLIAYCSYKTKLRFSIWEKSPSLEDSSSITTIGPDLNCNFTFRAPPLPRKSGRYSLIKDIPKSPVDSYDTPRHTLDRPEYASVNIPMVQIVHIDQNKKSQTSSI